ncbi:AAA family ATPase [Patescibacteria group bacterium]|nr:AAA family ATPase [Patescibacteria group bacterium]MBU2036200.1 AAA family ATPase [Patescibacteria group bacterium]
MATSALSEIDDLVKQIKDSKIPEKLSERILVRLSQLSKLADSQSFLPEYDRINKYIEWILEIPWDKKNQDNLDLQNAKKVLDSHHYGLNEIKNRILEYMSVMKLKQEKGEIEDVYRAPILCFVGLVGTGKTTIAYSIAEALGRQFARIPFGGMGDPLDLRGQSKMNPEAEPGKIIKALRTTQSINPVILLDEIDRVTDQGRASIMGVLVELLDPEQNHNFVDHYIDYPVNLSNVLFIATANNTTNISTAVLDRIEPITMPSYTDAEKITIGSKYILPTALKNAGIPEGSITISDDVWANIVRPLGYDAGIRTLERTIDGIVRKIAHMMVEGKGKTFSITPQNIKEFLPQ